MSSVIRLPRFAAPRESFARRTPSHSLARASQVIDRRVHTMSALLDDLLIFRDYHGALTLSRQPVTRYRGVDAARSCGSLDRGASPPAAHRRPHDTDRDRSRPPVAAALSNLLTNAAGYTDPRPDHVRPHRR
jgi:hypothetical protein